MIRKRKKFVRPRKLYIKTRIKEENGLLNKYALKSKREIWKTAAKVNYFRKRAMALAKASDEEQMVLFNKLKRIGLKTDSIAEILALKTEDLLERRLPTVLFKKGLSKTPQHARQMIVHKKVLIDGKAINIPGYIVAVEEESLISVKPGKEKKVAVKSEEIAQVSAATGEAQ